MKTLIYKRTHSGDPDPDTGVFGCNNCMGSVRSWPFEAVIGVGGTGAEPERHGIARKLTWIGIGKHERHSDSQRTFVTPKRPLVTFDHFLYFGPEGPLFKAIAPLLAKRIYGRNVRTLMNSLSCDERKEIERILRLAENEPPSGRLLLQSSTNTVRERLRRSCR